MKDLLIAKTTGMVGNCLSSLTANYSRFGSLLRKEVKKVILSQRKVWSSIAFVFSDWDSKSDSFGPKRIMLANFKSVDGEYKRYNYYIINNKEEAMKVVDLIEETFK